MVTDPSADYALELKKKMFMLEEMNRTLRAKIKENKILIIEIQEELEELTN